MPVIFPFSSSSLRNNACWCILDIVASLHSFVSRNCEIAIHCVHCVLHIVLGHMVSCYKNVLEFTF